MHEEFVYKIVRKREFENNVVKFFSAFVIQGDIAVEYEVNKATYPKIDGSALMAFDTVENCRNMLAACEYYATPLIFPIRVFQCKYTAKYTDSEVGKNVRVFGKVLDLTPEMVHNLWKYGEFHESATWKHAQYTVYTPVGTVLCASITPIRDLGVLA